MTMNEQIMKSTLTGIDDSDKQKSICNVCGLKDNILFLEKIDHLVEDLKYWTDEHRMDHGIFMYEDI